jgi:hypothetical protein
MQGAEIILTRDIARVMVDLQLEERALRWSVAWAAFAQGGRRSET